MSQRRIQPTTSAKADDVSFRIWREIFAAIVQRQKTAATCGQPVSLDLEVIQRVGCSDEAEQLIFVHITCEPGKSPTYEDYSGLANVSIAPLASSRRAPTLPH